MMPATWAEKLTADDRAKTARGPLHLETISEMRAIRAIEPEWQELWASLADGTPFQSPQWLLPWWEEYGEGHPLLMFVLRSQDHLVGIAPLYLFADNADGTRRLMFLGTGNSDFLDVICRPSQRREFWEAVLSQVQLRSEAWDQCDLRLLRAGSLSVGDSLAMRSQDLELSICPDEVCPCIDLRNSQTCRAMLKKAAYYGRRLDRESSWSIEAADTESLGEIFGRLEELHSKRWNAREMPGVLSEERDRRFHAKVARNFLRAGILRLYGLKIDGAIVAALYTFQHAGCVYYYLSGFDPAFKHLSLGSIVVGHAIEKALQQSCTRFSFLRGQESYKYRWGAQDEPTFRLTIGKRR